MRQILDDVPFFNRDADVVARELLGKYLVTERGGERTELPIVETEAYMGVHDLASHSSRGRTARTEVMFGPAGTWYVYLIYGMYEMLNVVVGPEGHPAAVLIRGVGKYDGPGKLTKALGIDRRFNGTPIGKRAGLWIEDRGIVVSDADIVKTPRVGVSYAGEWADAPLRFVWGQNS